VVAPVVGVIGGSTGAVVGSDPGVIFGIGGRIVFGLTTGKVAGVDPLGDGFVVGEGVPAAGAVAGVPAAGVVAGVFFSSGLQPTTDISPIAATTATFALQIDMPSPFCRLLTWRVYPKSRGGWMPGRCSRQGK
jgi:hypothetical protein